MALDFGDTSIFMKAFLIEIDMIEMKSKFLVDHWRRHAILVMAGERTSIFQATQRLLTVGRRSKISERRVS